MSYLNEYKWVIKPSKSLEIRKCCPGCKQKTNFINTEKFRVNANKDNIDVWLIYQCKKCKHTWNVNIYERINSKDIDMEKYKRFMDNDKELAKEYGLKLSEHMHNNVQIMSNDISYTVEKSVVEEEGKNEEAVVNIYCDYNIDLRVDKFLSDNLNISRSKIKAMIEGGEIFGEDIDKISKAKIKKGLRLHFLKGELLAAIN